MKQTNVDKFHKRKKRITLNIDATSSLLMHPDRSVSYIWCKKREGRTVDTNLNLNNINSEEGRQIENVLVIKIYEVDILKYEPEIENSSAEWAYVTDNNRPTEKEKAPGSRGGEHHLLVNSWD